MLLTLICAPLLAFTMAASGSDPTESFLLHGNRLMAQGRFAEAVAAYTRSLQQTPKEVKLYYLRALANEMVDRPAAIGDWKQFAEMVATKPQLKVARLQAQERARALEKMPVLPDQLHPSRYVLKAGDYYQRVAGPSVGLRWTGFPVRVFVDNTPEDWRRAVREALDAWMSVFPVQTVSTREKADIFLSWGQLRQPTVGSELDVMQVRKEDDRIVSRRKESFVTFDYSRPYSGREMRAVVLHELGHALGIGGHSDGQKDVMFHEVFNIIEVSETHWDASVSPGIIFPPGEYRGVSTTSGASSSTRINAKLTRRDVNTLIRLYNSPGPTVELK